MTPEEESELIEAVRKIKEQTGRSIYKIDRRTLNELRVREGELFDVDTEPLPVSRDT